LADGGETPLSRLAGRKQQTGFASNNAIQPSNASQNLVKALECVGFANEDFSALRYVRDQIKATRLFHPLDLLADPDDPRDLFGMLQRASQSRF
jgi:hypothetical protein